MEVRYTDGPDALIVMPVDHPPIEAHRGEWVDVPAEVAGRRAKGDDLGSGLLAQGWELRSAQKAARTRKRAGGSSRKAGRVKSEEVASSQEEIGPVAETGEPDVATVAEEPADAPSA